MVLSLLVSIASITMIGFKSVVSQFTTTYEGGSESEEERTNGQTPLVLAHGRVNDPMAKLQFLRVGWGGVGMMAFFELEHMLDATQLCVSCHCTHAGCYATVFVLSLHTCWMLCNCVCLVFAHMLDATQLCLSCHCTHAGCYATVFVLSLHACWMLRNCVWLFFFRMNARPNLLEALGKLAHKENNARRW